MYWQRSPLKCPSLGAASLLVLAISIGGHAFAQENRAATIDRDIATLTQQIASKRQQIATLRTRPSAEQAELNGARAKLAEAQAALKANASAENESRAKNAEFKVKLAEIKYDKAHPDVSALVDEVEQLQSQLATRQREAKEPMEPREAVAKPPATQPKASDNQAKQRQQEQELARSRQETEAQQKEIDRLKAALAAKEAKEAVAASPAPAPTPPAPARTATAPADPAPIAASATSAGGGALKLITAQEVAQEQQQLSQRLTAPGPERGANDALYLKRPNVKATNKDKVILRALGKEQYRGQAQVEAGQYNISIGFNQWPVEFGAGEAGQTTFLYDHSDPAKPRLFIYNSGLEAGK
jgi:myosin heavy subunit